eukprot:scaffold487233_cov18-Prasinocladus_malaysianus.AAC.1
MPTPPACPDLAWLKLVAPIFISDRLNDDGRLRFKIAAVAETIKSTCQVERMKKTIHQHIAEKVGDTFSARNKVAV